MDRLEQTKVGHRKKKRHWRRKKARRAIPHSRMTLMVGKRSGTRHAEDTTVGKSLEFTENRGV